MTPSESHRALVKKTAENEFPSFVIGIDDGKFSVEIPWQNLQVDGGPIQALDPLVIITRVIDLLEVLAKKFRHGFKSPKKVKHLKFIDAPGDPLGNFLQKSWQDPQGIYQSFCWEARINEQVTQLYSVLVKILQSKPLSCPANEPLYEQLTSDKNKYLIKWKIVKEHIHGILNQDSLSVLYDHKRITNGEFNEIYEYSRIVSLVFHAYEQIHSLRFELKKLRQENGKFKQEINNLQQKISSKNKRSDFSSNRSKLAFKKSPMKGETKKSKFRDFLEFFMNNMEE